MLYLSLWRAPLVVFLVVPSTGLSTHLFSSKVEVARLKVEFSIDCDEGRDSERRETCGSLQKRQFSPSVFTSPALQPIPPSHSPHRPSLPLSSPPACNQGCEVSGPRKCSHISKGSWAQCGSGQEKEKVKMNTVGEDEGMRAELINTSSGSESTPTRTDTALLASLFSS